ncbi:MAG: asparagine synthase (glutamine-hydrolyzing) [Candidatus Jorgensenbacteria bacterium]|nr:asparagine synthase (glutamine-hydrolyzing) [Candidatus Jorgensenbacteria bacterium]
MCGIAGIYHFKNSRTVDERTLVAMRDTLIHRGPDGGANYLSPDKKVGLSQRRLAIIDLSKEAACPMANEDGTVWITYNGEIYNFKPLREELMKRGHRLRTRGDTEVILHGYEEWGYDVVKKLNGMFAFAIWDERKKTLFAARDHIGIKPFYYCVQHGTFYFGSEIKAILAHPDFKKELNETGVSHYLTFSTTPAPHTLFKDVKKLPAAHYLTIEKDGSVRQEEYWNPSAASLGTNRPGSTAQTEAEYITKIQALLESSIRGQMVSDVPFGCFLSGGIDSSLNATLMSRALGRPVETFSVGYRNFEEKNEFRYSRLVAKSLGAKNHEILLDESHMRAFLPQYARYADDPNGDQVCFPLFWLSELTKQNGVTVIQIGEGSDEIFSGYPTYVKALDFYQAWNLFKKVPRAMREVFLKGFEVLNHARFDFGKEYVHRLQMDQEPFWGLAVAFGDHAKEGLLTGEFRERITGSSYAVVQSYYEELRKTDPAADLLKKMTYVEIKNRLPELLLARADKMTMAHSLEGRVPFLDTRLVELAFNMPTSIKIKGGEPKYILKKVAEKVIPADIQKEIIWRKKQGFSNTIGEWLKPEYEISKELIGTIFNSKLKERGLLNYDYVRYLVDAHQKNKADHNFRLWNLVTLSLWYDRWFA